MQNNLNNINVGGRNRILGSGDFSNWSESNSSFVTFSNGECIISVTGQTANRFAAGIGRLSLPYSEAAGEQLTVSFDVYSDDWSSVADSGGSTGYGAVAFQLNNVGNPPDANSSGTNGPYVNKRLNATDFWKVAPAQANSEWLHFESVPFILPGAFSYDTSKEIQPYLRAQLQVRMNGTIKFRHMKLEKGNKATDWTPAPEDHETYVDVAMKGGVNLAQTYCLGTVQTTQNVTCTGIGPTTIRLNGTAAANGTPTTLIFRAPKLEPGKYSL